MSLFKETICNEKIAFQNGFLQNVDPRAKSFCAAIMLIVVLTARSSVEVGLIYAVTVLLASISSIRLSFYLKRTLLFVPLFSFLIIIPSIFNFVTPGEPVLQLTFLKLHFAITRQGIDSAILFFLRVLSSVSIVILLVLTTPSHTLLKVLRLFRVPQLFVMTIGMTYRYIFLLLDNIQNTYSAIKSRIGFVNSTGKGRKIVGATIAGLWLKSYRLQSQVYNAMISRGYTGEPKIMDELKIGRTDIIIIIFTILSLAGTLCLNHFLY